MLVAQPILHHAVTGLLVYIMIGSLVWMWIYCSGYLARIYATELSGSGEVIDALANILITLILIIGWPGTLGVVLHWRARQ